MYRLPPPPPHTHTSSGIYYWVFNQFGSVEFDENINDDDNNTGGDNYCVCGTIKGLFGGKTRQNVICALLKGEGVRGGALMRKCGLL